MNDDAAAKPELPLTVAEAQEIFPIARSDRRKNADLFRDVISDDRLKDDAAFYAGLGSGPIDLLAARRPA